jgi:potassium uptake TrkH family protein
LNPAQLFIISFAIVILIGAFLLKMPNSTVDGISFLDALFTSTSAVCVTGLTVVDTQFAFTVMGKTVIMGLIQVGGLGIMTFASYFSFFFKGGSSFNNRLYFGELSNESELNNVFSSLKNVLLLTLIIESFGAIFLFFSTPPDLHSNFFEHVYFSIFHSVSAFNNAGFSLYSSNLYDPILAYNYPFQLIICFLIIFGGLGFPIMQNMLELVVYRVKLRVKKIFRLKELRHKAWIINTNTKIIVVTTVSLLVVGTVLFYIFEYNGVLADHGPLGKWVIAFMGSVTPRTAGFNSFDMGALAMPTVLITILLMWIGASPASTGGGIKTSTFAVACLNFLSLAKGQDRIEISKREVSNGTVRRAFAIIFLSLITIGIASFTLIMLEPNVRPLHLIFESFSAFSTVGLSINLTPSLGEGAKIILILLMFIGRVSTLTILIAVFEQVKQKNYKYPSEEVLIN